MKHINFMSGKDEVKQREVQMEKEETWKSGWHDGFVAALIVLETRKLITKSVADDLKIENSQCRKAPIGSLAWPYKNIDGS